jgi:hypothetical protein
VLTDLGDAKFSEKISLHESCRIRRCIDADLLLYSLVYCECDSHTVDKLSQRLLTANLLVSRESDCLWMRSKFSSDWFPSYITATRPVLEIFKMVGYIPDRPRTLCKVGEGGKEALSSSLLIVTGGVSMCGIVLFFYFHVFLQLL